ncbi:MAG: prephenate dehydratase [Candidatus Omnitrophica bacterium]|nr:prephenate dehydratase [Candidatus Omnitrophota bacterium]
MSLKDYRKKIDGIDERIVDLLNQRARVSLEIGKTKLNSGKGVYSADREKEIFERLQKLNQGPMNQEAFEAIYREIMSSSLSLEKSLKIAYLGPEASFTHLAAQKKFGSQVEYVPYDNLAEVFQNVERGECDYGVVPIENSIEGAVTHTFDLFVDSDLKICSQILLEISHNLLSKTSMDKIKMIYSNPQVFGQCRHWLQTHLPKAGLVDVASTTQAAQIAARQNDVACIASLLAAKIYQLRALKKDIQDSSHNITRFLVIAKEDVCPTGKDRTSLVCSIKDRVGALHAMLEPFAQHKINLTKIESRPSKKRAWEYYFFIDVQGHREDPKVKKALAQLEDMCKFWKILGSYPISE